MENYQLLCSCGHAVDVTPQSLQSSRRFRFRLPADCPECYKVNARSHTVVRLEIPPSEDMVRMYGSTYQLAWARDIRSELVKDFKHCIRKYPHDTQQTLTNLLVELVNQKAEAGWWVENVDDPLGAILRTCKDSTHIAILDVIRFHLHLEHRSARKSV